MKNVNVNAVAIWLGIFIMTYCFFGKIGLGIAAVVYTVAQMVL